MKDDLNFNTINLKLNSWNLEEKSNTVTDVIN